MHPACPCRRILRVLGMWGCSVRLHYVHGTCFNARMQDAPEVRVFSPERLREAVKEAGLNQQTLAFRLGRSLRGVQNWYSGVTAPKGQVLELLAEILGRETDWFFVE